ncbi:MalY/PatB family protein [Pseudoruegeria sp. SK021]|uniref:MalY/PatB family protein n=1 Tax=Pseudoruegeria sp. SK021 TaxID=1933035 RepID=UPI000A255E43|nr:MalY/PatB family protein [Pseudoruegeria sp. SK021]OSP55177.1 aminotransferase [Pseudoruegeria sp. SK021]
MNFDAMIDRRHTLSSKWSQLEPLYGLSAEDGLAMWVADMDFRAPDCVRDALRAFADQGDFGYQAKNQPYLDAISGWMDRRHGWRVDPDSIFTTSGLVNAVALCLETWTAPGDGVVLMTPVYHAFARVIRANDRTVVECPLAQSDGRYEMDFDAWDAQMTGTEKMIILCSPHNPGGRVWTREELQGIANFAKRHNLILISDEIHHDLVYPGHQHSPMALVDPDISDRLVMLTAASKTFSIAGPHVGNVILPDPDLRRAFATRLAAVGNPASTVGMAMVTAAYSTDGAAWLDALLAYLDDNRKTFDAGINAIPGLRSMPLEATYLSWVDFSGTGMSAEEITRRVVQGARIAPNYGQTFGTGGETYLRFNIGTQRARITEAVSRLQAAFADLQ